MLGRILCIGAGAMGGAILRGALEKGVITSNELLVTVRTEEHARTLEEELGISVTTSLPDWKTDGFDTILLAVKPQVLPHVLVNLKEIPPHTTCISIAAGITLHTLESALPQADWYRAMPNMPAAVGAGMTALAAGPNASLAVTAQVQELFSAIGQVEVVSEMDLDRLGALSGAGPGYAFLMMDALADAGVRIGLSRALAIKAAAQTLLGAGMMAIKTGTHPAILRDQVTSPGGTTIAGILAMEKGGLRSAIHDGIIACYERSNELGKS